MQKSEWLFIDSGYHTPAFNMALDEYLMNRGEAGDRRPVLRFYGWEPPGLSIGYFQKTAGRIDRDGLARHGIELVRRLTGGRAVLHHDELTYSIVMPENMPDIPASVVGAYRVLSAGLLAGFAELGLEAELAMPERDRRRERSPVCFEEASWYELVVEGKKAAGSAQTRRKGMLLQHGSLPLSVDLDELFDCFLYKDDRVKERAKQKFTSKAVSLGSLAGRTIALDEAKQAFRKGFEKGLGVRLEAVRLTEEEERHVSGLAETKYATDAWNFSR